MVSMMDLWLPVLLSAVFVFVASSVFHMLIPIHKGDYKKIPGEAKVMEAMRNKGVKPGAYMMPCPADMKDMGSPEMQKKYREGPVAWLTVLPNGAPAMGKSLVLWFLYSLVIGIFVAYVARVALPAGTDYLTVFRVAGTAAILGYALSYIQDSIWKGLSWTITAKFMFDGAVYSLLTAGTFAWLWPA